MRSKTGGGNGLGTRLLHCKWCLRILNADMGTSLVVAKISTVFMHLIMEDHVMNGTNDTAA